MTVGVMSVGSRNNAVPVVDVPTVRPSEIGQFIKRALSRRVS